jgi:cytochrome c oxidase subunit III
MSRSPVADSAAPESVGRFGMWVFLVTDAMSFGALLLAYAVLRARAQSWPEAAARLDVPLASVATFVLLASSLTMALAVDNAATPGAARRWLLATLALGLGFLALQAFEYRALARHGIGFGSDQAASSFFVATGWHGLHVLAGVVVLAVVTARGRLGALPMVALFWQFLDAVWILLFTFLYLV